MASMGEDGRGAWSRGQAAARVHRRGRAKQGGLTSAESRRTAREAQSQPGVGENRPPERPSVVGSQTQESKPGWNGKRPPERPRAVVGQPQELPESRGQSAPERSRVKAGRSPRGPLVERAGLSPVRRGRGQARRPGPPSPRSAPTSRVGKSQNEWMNDHERKRERRRRKKKKIS